MIELLLVINIGITFVILLTTSMLQNHFKKIERYITIYADKKVYKPQADTIFISSLLEKYQVISEYMKEKVDVGAMVSKAFYEQKVGKFQYTKVQSIATKGKIVMWVLLMTQIALELLLEAPVHTKMHFIVIISNTILCMIITLFGVIKSVPEEREKLLVKLADYIVNTYPAEIEWQKQQQDIKKLQDKVEKLQEELVTYQEQAKVQPAKVEDYIKKDEEPLKEKDIIHLIDSLT